MKHPQDQRMLRRALLGNASFSILCGLTLLAMAETIAVAIGLPESPGTLIIQGVGLALLPFAAGLIFISRRAVLRPIESWVAVGGDSAWVLGSIYLIALPPIEWTTIGEALIIGIASAVGICASLQALGLRRLTAAVMPVAD